MDDLGHEFTEDQKVGDRNTKAFDGDSQIEEDRGIGIGNLRDS